MCPIKVLKHFSLGTSLFWNGFQVWIRYPPYFEHWLKIWGENLGWISPHPTFSTDIFTRNQLFRPSFSPTSLEYKYPDHLLDEVRKSEANFEDSRIASAPEEIRTWSNSTVVYF